MYVSRSFRTAAAALSSCVVAICLAAGTEPALAKDTLRGGQTFEFGRLPNTVDDEGFDRQQRGLELSARSISRLDFTRKRDGGDQVRLSHWIEAEAYPEHEELDRLRLETRAGYWTKVTPATQLRFESGLSIVSSREQGVFVRPRLGAQLRYRHDKEHLSRARVRAGYRDQNEDTFEGFDQSELLVEIGHNWRPEDSSFSFAGTLFGEARFADKDRFGYHEAGARFDVRYQVNDDLRLTGQIKAAFRTYGDSFSKTLPQTRRDQRIRARVKADYRLSDHASVSANLGWDQAFSSVDLRAYEGVVFGIGLELSSDLWTSD